MASCKYTVTMKVGADSFDHLARAMAEIRREIAIGSKGNEVNNPHYFFKFTLENNPED